jgi:hypothetical protein
MMPFIEIYYDAGKIERGNEEVVKMTKVCDEELGYFLALDMEFADKIYGQEIQQHMAVLQRMAEVTKEQGQDELSAEVEEVLQKHMMNLR